MPWALAPKWDEGRELPGGAGGETPLTQGLFCVGGRSEGTGGKGVLGLWVVGPSPAQAPGRRKLCLFQKLIESGGRVEQTELWAMGSRAFLYPEV